MKNKLEILLITIAIQSNLFAQSELDWLKLNIQCFKTDSINVDFSGIEKAIGKASIVLLGEQSHGDGTTLETKVELVKFLHQKMGFEILAFESNQYNAERAWQDVLEKKNPIKALQKSTFPIWGEANEMLPLFEYINAKSKTKNPLYISGFDCQVSGYYVENNFQEDLIAFLKEKNIEFTDTIEQNFFFNTFNQFVFTPRYIKKMSISQKVVYNDSLKKLKPQFESILLKKEKQLSKVKGKKALLFSQFLYSTRKYLPAILHFNQIDKVNYKDILRNVRDSVMGENIVWLAEKYYSKRKIIVWAASYHLAKHKTIGYGDLKETLVGDYIRDKLDNKTYTIAFTAYEGETGWYNGKNISTVFKPNKNSFEELFYQTGCDNFFLDLKTNSKSATGQWLMTPKIMRPLGYVEQEKIWPKVFDAVIFNKKMKKVTPIKDK